MIKIIGSPSPYTTTGNGPSTAGLEARLVRYQKELSDCVNCGSAKTLTGKAKIEEVANKIGEIKNRIRAVDVEKSGSLPPASNPIGQTSIPENSNVGNLVNVFA